MKMSKEELIEWVDAKIEEWEKTDVPLFGMPTNYPWTPNQNIQDFIRQLYTIKAVLEENN